VRPDRSPVRRVRAVRVLAPLLTLMVLLGIWEVYVDAGGVSPLVLPAPHGVAQALYEDRGALASNLWVTAREILLGILAACVVALPAATAIHLSKVVRYALYPLLVGSQAVPVVVFAPVLVVWLGFGLLPKLVIIALVSFFPLVVTTLAAVERVDPELLKLMRSFDAGRWRTYRLVELPAALPGLVTGAKLAAVFSVIGAVFAEQSGSSSGLGYLLTVTVANLETTEAFATAAVLALLAIALFMLLTVLERWALPWANRPTFPWSDRQQFDAQR
jgi:putative hydroxymethylpyrimidine transport system permease protein